MNDLQHRFNSLREEAQLGGGTDRIAAQHAKGKATARERIEKLLDPDSFHEIGQFVTHRAVGLGMEKSHPFGDGVVTGWGKIDGRVVYLFAQDFTVMGGSVGEVHGKKIAHLMDLAIQSGAPLIGLNDSGGARIQEGVDALAGYGEIFMRNVQASGVIPQISVILGPCAGGAVYSPAITDFVFMVEKNAHMFITGPEVVKTVTREEISAEDLGGAEVHSNRSGVAHFTAADEEALLQKVRWLLSFLPSNNLAVPLHVNTGDDLSRETPEIAGLIPENPQHPYDILKVVEAIADNGDFLEVQSSYATNLVVGFIHLNGNPVGVVANQPDTYAGVLDINASDKGARFIRFCDAFHIPLLTLVDTPGFMPGAEQEYGGIIRHGAKMIFAYAEATVPKVSLILRKAYGGAYIVMSSKHLGSDLNYSLPGAEIAVMGPEAAVNVVFRKELENATDREGSQREMTQKYREELATPLVAAARGYLDDILQPQEIRPRLIQSFEMLKDKRQAVPKRKHGNIPL